MALITSSGTRNRILPLAALWPATILLSPCLSNIYLDRLDKFVETILMSEYNRGALRKPNPEYRRVQSAVTRARRRGDDAAVRELRKQQRSMPSMDPQDPGYRRLRYSRYADDHLLGFTGPKVEAERIKDQLAAFLHDELKLELSAEKTLITHARSHAARYLGYEIIVQNGDSKIIAGQRAANGKIALRVPLDVIKAKCAPYLRHGKAWHRSAMQNLDDYDIVKTYGAEYRGIVQYYLLANDVWRFDRLCWDAQTSMLKTLAAKHQSSVAKMAAKHRAKIETPNGRRTCYEVRVERPGKQPLVARFGGIPLVRDTRAVIVDRSPSDQVTFQRKELVRRLLARRCELCGEPGQVIVHQVRNLASLEKHIGQPDWAALMLRKRRKTLVVCHPCHDAIHVEPPAAKTA